MKILCDAKLLFTALMFLFSCQQIPEGVTAVGNFNKDKYLGKWYEIARFDFRFERNLNQTTATYTLNEDGTIKVVNQGYHTLDKKWNSVTGKAKFAGADTVASLKVSFFGPFYAGYNVIALDPDYQFALVCGSSKEYLWILSRQTTLPDSIKSRYLKIASEYGFDINKLLWVEH